MRKLLGGFMVLAVSATIGLSAISVAAERCDYSTINALWVSLCERAAHEDSDGGYTHNTPAYVWADAGGEPGPGMYTAISTWAGVEQYRAEYGDGSYSYTPVSAAQYVTVGDNALYVETGAYQEDWTAGSSFQRTTAAGASAYYQTPAQSGTAWASVAQGANSDGCRQWVDVVVPGGGYHGEGECAAAAPRVPDLPSYP